MDIKRLFGTYRAVVVANNDPLELRRLKLSIQTAPGQTTDWIYPSEPAGIKSKPPSIGQGVWVQFLGGDPEYPVWCGIFGKNLFDGSGLLVNGLPSTTSLTGITDSIIIKHNQDGTSDVDLIASLLALAHKLQTLDAAYFAYVALHP